jgi:hypothetical protein
MSDTIDVFSRTQIIEVDPTAQIVFAENQELVIDPSTQEVDVVSVLYAINVLSAPASVSVINAGPQGPPGASNIPSNLAQAAFQKAESLGNKEIGYTSGLPSIIRYLDGLTLVYESAITYSSGLPVLIQLTRLSDNQVFEKEITYTNSLPVSVEWRVV